MPLPLNPTHNSTVTVPPRNRISQPQNYERELICDMDEETNRNRAAEAGRNQRTYAAAVDRKAADQTFGAENIKEIQPGKSFSGHEENSVMKIANLELSTEKLAKLAEESRNMKEQLICKDCRAFDASVAFMPCGHLISCQRCDEKLERKNCQMCNTIIKNRICVYNV